MFDFAWTEIALIGVVALVAIGPKDLPVAIKTVASMVKKARRMAGEFQTHVDEMIKDTDLKEVRGHISALRNLDIKGTIERAVDGDGSIRATINDNPIAAGYTPPPSTDAPVAHEVAPPQASTIERPAGIEASGEDPPAFVPPAVAHPVIAPAFVPPAAARARQRAA